MSFDYYYGSQADQFSFVKIPRLLLTGEIFSTLSIASKVLYGVLLDRMTLSMKNGWLDEENRAYIIYQIGEIQEDLGFSKKKAMELLSELEKFGLLEKKRRGHGLPNLLYVKNFMPASRSSKTCTSETDPCSLEVPKTAPQEVPKPELLEVPKSAPLKNKTNKSYTYMSYTESDLISSAQMDMIRSDASNAIHYENLIKSNIDYNSLLISHPHDQELIQGIVDLILETILSGKNEILIASDWHPKELVKSKLLKLNYGHIEYVLECLRTNTTKVKNIKKYLLATLFNAPSTIDGYYQAEVNHDMAQFAI